MFQSALASGARSGIHVAIIMDGNGRWAAARGLRRAAGHRAGAHALRRVLEAAPALGIRTLTVYALSSDNWQRPPREVAGLLDVLRDELRCQAAACLERNVRIRVIGRRDRLPAEVLEAIEGAERLTRACDGYELRIAVDYSSRRAMLQAAMSAAIAEAASVAPLDAEASCSLSPDVDLLIRTGGEQRLSDFLLWECAYAELYFTSTLWPDFDGRALAEAVAEFSRRDRRFGRVPAEAAAP